MPTNLIPALDPASLPGPPWLFHLLWVVTFLIHVLFMNVVLGGSLLAALAGSRRVGRQESARFFVEVNSWGISLAITFGIAPLLFMQVIYGRFFYTATILVAWLWLGLLGLLTVAYYLNYVAKHRLRADRPVSVFLWIEAFCFLVIASIQVAVNLLHLQPTRWEHVADRTLVAFADPSFVPRFLHFVLAAVVVSGAFLAWSAVRRSQRGGDRAVCDGMARWGVQVALVGTVLQLVDGFWLLLTLPENVLRAFMRGGAATIGLLTLGIAAGVLLLVVLAQISDPLASPAKARWTLELVVGATALMILNRHQLRELYLAFASVGASPGVAAQWGVFALFLVVFLGCLGLTAWAVMRASNDRPAPGEESA
jgi:hypothetical protein